MGGSEFDVAPPVLVAGDFEGTEDWDGDDVRAGGEVGRVASLDGEEDVFGLAAVESPTPGGVEEAAGCEPEEADVSDEEFGVESVGWELGDDSSSSTTSYFLALACWSESADRWQAGMARSRARIHDSVHGHRGRKSSAAVGDPDWLRGPSAVPIAESLR